MKGNEYQGVLVFAEQNNGKIHPVSYELLRKGRELSDELGVELSAVLLSPGKITPEELIYCGADKVFLYENPLFSEPDEILYKENLVSLIKKEKPEIFLVGATNFGRSLAPRIAAALKTGLTADCTGLEIHEDGKLLQIRPACSSTLLARILNDRYPQMATIRYKEFEEAERNPVKKGKIIKKEVKVPEYSGVRTVKKLKSQEVNITDAEIVVSGGRGLREPEDLGLLLELANLLKGVVGSSRPLVDEGWIDRSHQVGYSGNRVKPRLYIACGISGAFNHLAGMKDSEIIVAINTDPSAPIFKVADYGIIGDLYKVIPEMINQLKEDRNGKPNN